MTSIERSNRSAWLLGAVAAVACVAVALAAIGLYRQGAEDDRRAADQAEQNRTNSCVAMWAQDYAARADRLNDLSEARNTALDNALLAVIAGASPARVQVLAQRYRKAVLARRHALKHNPLPASPKFLCGERPATATHRPSASRTAPPRTSSTPTPGALPAPIRTVTRAAPNSTVTTVRTLTVTSTATRVAMATRTVTRTVTARPGPPLPTSICRPLHLC